MTPYQFHVERFRRGCGSHLCSAVGTRVVFSRGSLPCDVLFVGEAPWTNENATGQPFVGPAGKLLDKIVARALVDFPAVTFAFTNLVGCIPRNEKGEIDKTPDDDAIKCCEPKLLDMISIANPKLIVCLGKIPTHWLDVKYKNHIKVPPEITQISVTHPSGILQANVADQGLLVQRSIVAISEAVHEFMEGKNARTDT